MAALTIETGVYFIQNAGTGTVLDLTGGSNANGTKVQGFTKREINDVYVSAQLWLIAQVPGTDEYTIQNANSQTYLDLTGSNVQSGTPLIGYQPTGNPNQRWIIKRNSTNTAYVIGNGATGTYVDLLNGGSANGTAVNGWAGEGPATTNPHQLWHVVRA
ncbi:ricin B-like lectin [Dichomitus squalens]|uniref:Ricin B-like lectin n=1 Tax=Dichomitus squalens TaxID=114155 RepID=A0A4Q9NEC4_9APHY|nr:ricin B-like lectin [Dichomitus squalens]TBU53851.1 ricin B-like lectin [Dichomitus squalens]